MKDHRPKTALKLAAKDTEDLGIISTITQDALVHPKGMAYDAQDQKFHILANRLCWEHIMDGNPHHEVGRVHSGLHFDHVEKAEYTGFNQQSSLKPLSLMSIQFKEPYVHLTFAEQQKIRLKVGKMQVKMQDVTENWPAGKIPCHGHEDEC